MTNDLSTTNDPRASRHRHPGSRRGVLTIIAIFALGLAVFVGLYLSPKSRAPSLPPGVSMGLPSKPIRGVMLDCRPYGPSAEAIVRAIRQHGDAPDLLVLVDVESFLVPPVIEAFGMQPSYHAELFQRAQGNANNREKIGLCILSRHALYEGTPVRVDRRTVGVETMMVVENRAMRVRCLALDDAPPPPVNDHPKAALVGSPLVLTAGRLAGQWQVRLQSTAKDGGKNDRDDAVAVTAHDTAPVVVAFTLHAEASSAPATGPATAESPVEATSQPVPSTRPAESR